MHWAGNGKFIKQAYISNYLIYIYIYIYTIFSIHLKPNYHQTNKNKKRVSNQYIWNFLFEIKTASWNWNYWWHNFEMVD